MEESMIYLTLKRIIICSLFIILTGCASGSVIVTGEKRTPTDPSMVKLYLEAPPDYEVIGIVNSSSDMGWTEQGSQDYAVREIKYQAAKLGANGVILESTGEKRKTSLVGYDTGFLYPISVTAKTVSGKAIYVQN